FIEQEGVFYKTAVENWDTFINRQGLYALIRSELANFEPAGSLQPEDITLAPPMGTQEIWAAGVTYKRSKEARMEESKGAGGGSFYDRVYDAARPELFFKAGA